MVELISLTNMKKNNLLIYSINVHVNDIMIQDQDNEDVIDKDFYLDISKSDGNTREFVHETYFYINENFLKEKYEN